MGEESEKGWYVGTSQNEDGSVDYSRAGKLLDPNLDERLDRHVAKQEAEKAKERARALETPDEVKPGTSDMVWYRLKRAIYLNQEELEETKKAGGKTERLAAKIEGMDLEREVLEGMGYHQKEKVERQLKKVSETKSAEGIRQILRDSSAIDTLAVLEEQIDFWEDIVDKKGSDYFVGVSVHRQTRHPVADVLKAAKNLSSRLADEGNRFQHEEKGKSG